MRSSKGRGGHISTPSKLREAHVFAKSAGAKGDPRTPGGGGRRTARVDLGGKLMIRAPMPGRIRHRGRQRPEGGRRAKGARVQMAHTAEVDDIKQSKRCRLRQEGMSMRDAATAQGPERATAMGSAPCGRRLPQVTMWQWQG